MNWRRTALGLSLVLLTGMVCYCCREARLERSQNGPIRAAAERYGVERALVKAVVWRESKFNPTVHGRANEIGLMQLQEVAAQEWADAEHISSFVHEQC